MLIKKISKQKKKDNGDLWIYNQDINETIKKFVKTQGDCNYYLS